jgi:autotransporter-associated beta strand protein
MKTLRLALSLLLLYPLACPGEPDLPLDGRSLWELDFPIKEQYRLAALIERGVLEIAPVVQAPLTATHTHLGWPVATMLPSGRIVLVFRQRDGHNGSDEGDRWVIYTDNLETWHPAGVLADKALRLGDSYGMYAIGWAPRPDNGEPRLVMAVGNTPAPGFTKMVYLSDDAGQTWGGPTSLNPVIPVGNQTGPNLIQHPVFGLLASWGQPGMQPFDPNGPRGNYLTRTLDAGLTWETREWINAEPSLPIEPAIATWGPGHMVILARDYSEFGYGDDPERKYFHLTQHVYAYEEGHTFQDVNFTTVASNIAGNGATTSEPPGRNSQDTADVFFNPVTGRVEMLQSHRWGTGGPDTEHTLAETLLEERSSLNLWSIDPDALLAGSNQWRFDGTVMERVGYARPGNKDGLHPGGSVLDVERGMQHIFVYAGWRRGPASIYRISRTLDTALWLAAVAEVEEELAGFVEPEPVVPAVYWTGEGNRYGGQTNAWSTIPYTDPAFPVYGLASANGVSSGDTWRFSYDFAGMRGSTSTVRMNRDNVTMASLTLKGPGVSGFTFTNVDNIGTGHMLAGPVTVLGGVHTFNAPAAGRAITLTADSTWTIAGGSTLFFNHVLSGAHSLNKTGDGTLLITGNQLHTGDNIVDRGVFGAGGAPASLAGDLYFGPGARLRFNPGHTLTVAGLVNFEDDFGIGNLDGLDGTAALGSCQLIAGTIDSGNLRNVGITRAAPIGPGKWAYFEVDGGLSVTVVDAVPDSPAVSLEWLHFEASRPVWGLAGPAGARITIQSSSDLLEWKDAAVLFIPEPPAQWTDPEALTEPARFYRIHLND